jgi:hypothetical protein
MPSPSNLKPINIGACEAKHALGHLQSLRTTLKDFRDPLGSPIPREDEKTTKMPIAKEWLKN